MVAITQGPLSGVRIVDLTRHVAGPFCTMILGDLGADVLKVEEPIKGSPERAATPLLYGQSTYFLGSNRSKRSIGINLKSKEGLDIVKKLTASCDVFVENFRPGVAKRLGVSYEELRKTNQKLVYCSISGYGQDGPMANKPSYDLIAQSLSGLLSLYTDGKNTPLAPLGLSDLTTAMIATQAILTALYAREKKGLGQQIDISLLESSAFLLQYMAIPLLNKIEKEFDYLTRARQVGFMGIYRDSEEKFLVIEAPDDRVFERASAIPEFSKIVTDSRFSTRRERAKNWEDLHKELEKILVRKPRKYWVKVLSEIDVPCAPVLAVSQALADHYFGSREAIVELDKSKTEKIRMINLPMRFSETKIVVTKSPPLLGEDTQNILQELGYSEEQITNFRAKGVI